MDFTNLTNYLDYLVNEVNTPGVDCIVYKNHEMIYRHFAGKSDIEADKNIVGDEIYIIYSMTKVLTCTAALKLYEQGKYKLMIAYSYDKEPAEIFEKEVNEAFPGIPVYTDCLSLSVSCHIGPGSLALAVTIDHLA